MAMCLRSLGYDVDEDTVNKVMGAQPMRGAAWENALACAQHFGCRATLVVPATVAMLKTWTDAGTPVMIAWNPEGRDWSHASAVYDVTEAVPNPLPDSCVVEGEGVGPFVWVADPNIPNPEKTTRIVSADTFYKRWFEKFPNYLVRRPALAIEREITPDGRQVVASARSQTSCRSSLMSHPPVDFTNLAAELRPLAGGQERADNLLRLWRATGEPATFTARARSASYSAAAIDLCVTRLASDTEAKFEEGESADPTKHMTDEQKKEWWKHHHENKDNFTGKEAAGGRYGFPKTTQRDVEATIRGIEQYAAQIAATAWDRDERVARFLEAHARRTSSLPARILAEALKDATPKTAVTAGVADRGLYGFPARTARLGLNLCTQLREFVGTRAYELHTRRATVHEKITGFLREHTKSAKCGYARLLLASYPDDPGVKASRGPKTASIPDSVGGWLAWE